jgi:hypothetical protein
MMESGCAVLVDPVESDTVTKKLNAVAEITTGAVPLNAVPSRESHAGTLIPFHVNGAVPPLFVSDLEYEIPDVVPGKLLVVTAGTALITRENALVEAAPRLSAALTVKA